MTRSTVSMDERSSHTSGAVTLERTIIGGATSTAMRSGLCRASRLGTSSPSTSEKKVMAMISSPKPMASPYGWSSGKVLSQAPHCSPRVAPPYAPAPIPMTVMPISTVERKPLGSSMRRSAAAAPREPQKTMRLRRERRDETTASYDMAKTPFNKMSKKIMNISHKNIDDLLFLVGRGPGGRRAIVHTRVSAAACAAATRAGGAMTMPKQVYPAMQSDKPACVLLHVNHL